MFLLTCSLPSVPVPDPSALPPKRGLLVSLSPPPSPPSGDSSTVATWFMVAWGLEITVEFFMFSAVVTGACLLGFPPNNLLKSKEERRGEKKRISWAKVLIKEQEKKVCNLPSVTNRTNLQSHRLLTL